MDGKTKKIFGKVLNIFSILLLIFAMGMLVFVAAFKIMNKTPQIFGYSFHFVVSESMEDDIKVGDLVVGKSTDINDIKPEDDIIFVSPDPSLEGKTIVHRVRYIDDSDGVRKIYTYGIKYDRDDNDSYPVTEIIGKVSSVSTFWGKVFNPISIVFILLLMGMIVIFYLGLKSFIKSHRELKKESGFEVSDQLKDELRAELYAGMRDDLENSTGEHIKNGQAEGFTEGESGQNQSKNDIKSD